MPKESYTLKHVQMAYAAFGGASFDMKQGISEDGVTIEMAEDFGERTMGGDGSTLWSEYVGSNGTVTLSIMANSPAYPFFVNLQTVQRQSGTKGRDSATIINKDFNESITCSNGAIRSISGEKYDKRGNAYRTVVIDFGSITRIAA